MIIPIRTDYRMTLTPWVNYLLVAANVILFGLEYVSPAFRTEIQTWLLQPDNPQLYQFFTCMFLHGGFWHLAGNMIFLWVFGNAINDRFGHAGYLAFYLAGGILAGVGYLLLSGTMPVLGASGAIAAVTGAYLVLLPRARVTLLVWLFYFILPLEVSSLYFLLFQLGFNVLMSFQQVAGSGEAGGVAFTAHSAGYVFGIAIAAAMLASKLLPRDQFDLLHLLKSVRRRQEFRSMVAEGYDPFNYGRPGTKPAPQRYVQSTATDAPLSDTHAARELDLRRQISQVLLQHDVPSAIPRYLELLQINPQAILPRQQQLDVANQLMASEQHAVAADAYERFLAHYGNYEYVGDIYLMLGLLYGRYLQKDTLARTYLERAAGTLSDRRKLDLARSELQALADRQEPGPLSL